MTPFNPVASRDLPAIHAHARAWDHPCGLRHIHIHAADPHLSMLVHVPTSSDSDDGVAHALEHMVMEGSVNYPVDNIISRLSERTMSTFMNAMTSPSATMYPFSSANQADFAHIAQVYLDCVFNPRLPQEAFASEVSRVSIKDDKKVFDGVVFNEMRGVFSDPARIEHQQQRRWLAPDSPLTRNSGGDPVHIVDLTMEQLRRFHAENYHPSRCTVVSYGDVNPALIQELVCQAIEPVLARAVPMLAAPPAPSTAPIQDAVIDIPCADGQAEHGLLLAWPLPATSSRFEQSLYRAYAALLSRPGGPLSDCLDEISPASISQCSPVIVADRHYLLIAAASLASDQVATAGERIQAALHTTLGDLPHLQTIESLLNDTQLSLLMRTASSNNLGHHMCMSVAQVLDIHSDPDQILQFIDDHALLGQLRQHPINEGFACWLSGLVRVDPHRAHVCPDPGYYDNIARKLDEKLSSREPSRPLAGRSSDASSLPVAEVSPGALVSPPPVGVQWIDAAPGVSVCHVQGGVEGAYEIDLVADLSSMEPHRIEMVQSAIMLANMVGVGDTAWKDHAARRQQDGFSPSTHTDVENRSNGQASVLQRVSQTSLAKGLEKACWHMVQMVSNCNYDPERLSIILASVQESLRSQTSARAHEAAHTHVVAGFTPSGSINVLLRGFDGDMAGLSLARMSQHAPADLVKGLIHARDEVMGAPMAIRVIGRDVPAEVMQMASHLSALRPGGKAYHPGTGGRTCPEFYAPHDTAFMAPMHVNNCVQSWQGPGLFDPQGPAAGLLAQVVSDQYLYGALRDKGGAYGAAFVWTDGCFRAASFRDPRLPETFADFDGALQWIASGAITQEHLHQARIKQLAQATAPVSLLKRAENAWNREVIGVDLAARDRFVRGLLEARVEDLLAVAGQWLSPNAARVRCASIGPQWKSAALQMGLHTIDVPAEFSGRPTRSPSP